MSNIRLELADLHRDIDMLRARFPELDDDEVLRADMFEAETSLHEVVGKLLERAREAETMAEAIKLRQDDLAARKARYERQKEAMRDFIQTLMERTGQKKLPLPEATISMGFRAPSPIVVDEAALPDDCVKTIRKPDMAAIKAKWAADPSVPGVRLSNGSSFVTIRSK